MRKVNTKDLFGWSLTQYSKFSRNDKLLLVCGVSIPDNLHEYPDVSLGRGAVFTVPGKLALLILKLTLLLLSMACPVLANSVDPDQLASVEAN